MRSIGIRDSSSRISTSNYYNLQEGNPLEAEGDTRGMKYIPAGRAFTDIRKSLILDVNFFLGEIENILQQHSFIRRDFETGFFYVSIPN